jgi:hypothetical protein
MFGDDGRKSEPDSGGNKDDTGFWQCFLPFSSEHFAFSSAGCETWSLILREEHRMRVFEKRMLKIFKPKRDEVVEGCRKLHNEERLDLYYRSSIIRMKNSMRITYAGHVARMEPTGG